MRIKKVMVFNRELEPIEVIGLVKVRVLVFLGLLLLVVGV